MIERVEDFCQQNKLFDRGDAIVVACSGGPDSLALADILLRMQQKWDLRLCIAHFEHGIRGAASEEDAAFVKSFAAGRDVFFRMESGNVPAYAHTQGLSLETAARDMRYAFLRRVSRELGGAHIAVAHHADDQAETVLMHILRGSGLDGLAGMRPARAGIIRPMLTVTRQEIEAYCAERGLKPRHDATNDIPDCRRNQLRLGLLPELRQKYNPSVTAALCQLSLLAADESDFISAEVEGLWTKLTKWQGTALLLDAEKLKAKHPVLQRAVFRRAAEKLRGSLQGIGFVHIEALRDMLKGPTGTRITLPGELTAQMSYGWLRLEAGRQEERRALAPAELKVPGVTDLPASGLCVEAELLMHRPELQGPWQFCCDFDRLEGRLFVRQRQPGDRLQMSYGSKKLKDFFVDVKVPRDQRDDVLLFCDGRGILWVAGLRGTILAQTDAATKRFLYLRISKK